MEVKILYTKISNLKECLYMLLSTYNLTDEPVVNCSQNLDKLIVEYQKYVS